jgi:hypothetical protein
MGPTAILPRSHVLGLDKEEAWSNFGVTMPVVQEHKLAVPEGKGAAVLIHCEQHGRGWN